MRVIPKTAVFGRGLTADLNVFCDVDKPPTAGHPPRAVKSSPIYRFVCGAVTLLTFLL